jgi:hypothetical protein
MKPDKALRLASVGFALKRADQRDWNSPRHAS